MHIRRHAFAFAIALAAAVVATSPTDADAQQVGAGASWLTTDRSDLPGGPGAWLRFSWAAGSILRLEAAVGRDWGSSARNGQMCDSYWPDALGCMNERIELTNTVSWAEANVLLVSPSMAGFRLGFGGGLASTHYDVSQYGTTSRRTQWPADVQASAAPTLLGVVEYAPIRALAVEARMQATEVSFTDRSCVMDSWAVCGEASFRRYTLGLRYLL